MSIVRWHTRRICILVTAAVFIVQWLFLSQSSSLLQISTEADQDPLPPRVRDQSRHGGQQQGSGRERPWSLSAWTDNRLSDSLSHAIDRVFYKEYGASRGNTGDINGDYEQDYDASDINDEEGEGFGIDYMNAGDDTPDKAVGGELDDGQEDPTYYPGELRIRRDMPFWFEDWVTSKSLHPSALWPEPNAPFAATATATAVGTDTDPGTETSSTGDNSGNSKIQEPSTKATTSDSSTTPIVPSPPLLLKKHYPRRPAELDLVYTWVNGSDPIWQYSKHHYAQQQPAFHKINLNNNNNNNNNDKVEGKMDHRFRDNNELLHAVRSTSMYGDQVVRKIFIVAADSIEESLWKAMERGEEAVKEKEEKSRAGTAELFVFDPESLGVDGGDKAEEDADAEGKAELEFLRRVDNFTVIDSDAPMRRFVPKKAGPAEEAGQVPSWLNRSITTREKIDVVHHSAFFKHKNSLPVFNSVAIESQLHRIPGLSDVFMYLNDDIFFGMPMSQADFWTPQYGHVFQLLLHMRVTPFPTDFKGAEHLDRGYNENIQYANLQLSRRFGFRHRPFIAHIGHVASRSILEEAEALWPGAFFQTEKSRFRFSYDGHGLQTMFLMAHYTIERLRETQLRSFWRYRVDYNGNGVLEWEERWALFALIMDWTRSGDRANLERMGLKLRTASHFITDNKDVLHKTGFRDANQAPGVAYKVSGMDGSPHLMSLANTSLTIDINNKTRQTEPLYTALSVIPVNKNCHFDLNFCLGPKFMTRHGTLSHQDGEEVFKRLAFKEYHCGDCLLQVALQSDRGVEHFRERIEDAEDDDWGDRVPFTAPVDVRTRRPTRGPSAKRRQPPPSIITPIYRQEMDDVAYDLRRLHNFGKKKKHRYTKHKRGISAILPSSTQHPKARTRVLQDLYQYNFVVGTSHHVFGVFDNLRDSKRIIKKLHDDRSWNKPHHMLSLNDAVVLDSEEDNEEERANGLEVRRLMKEFLEDRYGAPSPWEKAHGGSGGSGREEAREEEDKR